jgi:hypothetical protein
MFGRVQHQELSSRWLSNVHELTNILIVEKSLRVGAPEGPYHPEDVMLCIKFKDSIIH